VQNSFLYLFPSILCLAILLIWALSTLAHTCLVRVPNQVLHIESLEYRLDMYPWRIQGIAVTHQRTQALANISHTPAMPRYQGSFVLLWMTGLGSRCSVGLVMLVMNGSRSAFLSVKSTLMFVSYKKRSKGFWFPLHYLLTVCQILVSEIIRIWSIRI